MINEQLIALDQIEGIGSAKVYTREAFETGGSWIDNRSIYCKVITIKDLDPDKSYNIPHEIESLGLIINYYGMLRNETFQCSMENTGIISMGTFYIGGDYIRFTTTSEVTSGFDATIILEYVKETP